MWSFLLISGRQYKLKGRAVNVPTKVQTNVQILPRISDETQTIPIALKRSMDHKSNYLYEAIRPGVIFKALDSLQNCEVFNYLKIQIDKDRLLNDINSVSQMIEESDMVSDDEPLSEIIDSNIEVENNDDISSNESEDNAEREECNGT